MIHLIDAVTDPVHHERGDSDLRQERAHIDRLRHLSQQKNGTRTRAETHEGRGPLQERLVAGHGRRDRLHPLRCPPTIPHGFSEVGEFFIRPTPGIVVAVRTGVGVPVTVGVGSCALAIVGIGN